MGGGSALWEGTLAPFVQDDGHLDLSDYRHDVNLSLFETDHWLKDGQNVIVLRLESHAAPRRDVRGCRREKLACLCEGAKKQRGPAHARLGLPRSMCERVTPPFHRCLEHATEAKSRSNQAKLNPRRQCENGQFGGQFEVKSGQFGPKSANSGVRSIGGP